MKLFSAPFSFFGKNNFQKNQIKKIKNYIKPRTHTRED